MANDNSLMFVYDWNVPLFFVNRPLLMCVSYCWIFSITHCWNLIRLSRFRNTTNAVLYAITWLVTGCVAVQTSAGVVALLSRIYQLPSIICCCLSLFTSSACRIIAYLTTSVGDYWCGTTARLSLLYGVIILVYTWSQRIGRTGCTASIVVTWWIQFRIACNCDTVCCTLSYSSWMLYVFYVRMCAGKCWGCAISIQWSNYTVRVCTFSNWQTKHI